MMHIKLSKPAAPTRRLVFQAAPDWLSLSTRVSELYHIPRSHVTLGYIDPLDGDVITLNSGEELTQCLSVIPLGDTARFVVQDLREVSSLAVTLRAAELGSEATARTEEDDEPDWVDASDPLFELRNVQDKLLAIRELEMDSRDESRARTAQQPAAVYENYMADLMSHETTHETLYDSALPSGAAEPTISPKLNSIEDRPLPMATASDANTEYDDGETSIQSEDEEDVLPIQRNRRTSSSNPSIISDLTMLVSALSSASSCHPEVTMGLFNLLSNTKSGTYWSPLKRDVRRFASKTGSEVLIAAQAICTEGIRAATEARTHGLEMDERMRSAKEAMRTEAELRMSEAMGAVMREFSGFNSPPSP